MTAQHAYSKFALHHGLAWSRAGHPYTSTWYVMFSDDHSGGLLLFRRGELKDLDELLPDLLLPKLHLHAPLIQLLAPSSGPGSHAARALTVGLVLLHSPTTRSSGRPFVLREVQPLLGTLQPPNQLA